MRKRHLIGPALGVLIMTSCGGTETPTVPSGQGLQAQGLWPQSRYVTSPSISSISPMIAYNADTETYEKFAMRVNFNIVSTSQYSSNPVLKYELIIDDTVREYTTFIGDSSVYPVGKSVYLETTYFYSGTHKYQICTYGQPTRNCSAEVYYTGQ